jgi:hypothetical protein
MTVAFNIADPSPLESLLLAIAETLDVPPSAYEQATERYAAVGAWLCREGSALRSQQPGVYAQGSFSLGTVVRPLRGDDYDIDAVVEFAGPKESWEPEDLKAAVGARLRENEVYRPMLQPEGRRCWTLQYSGEGVAHGFHMDLLPSVPIVPVMSARSTAIAITNRVSINDVEWRESDPKRYKAWFLDRMKTLSARRLLTDKRAGVEAVPHYAERTPLQYVVQLLKRYRDVLFQTNDEHAPISVIITTLAAHAYQGEESLEESLFGVLTRMPDFVEREGGRIVIPNPVRLNENFADRWEGDIRKEKAFLRWLDAADRLRQELRAAPPEELEATLNNVLGESSTRMTLAKYASQRTAAGARSLIRAPQHATATIGGLARSVGGTLAGWARLLAEALHRQAPRWPIEPDSTVATIRGTVVGARGVLRGNLTSGDAVEVGASLRFEALTTADLGEEIFWQVTNTGAEAQRANNLRGRFERGSTVKQETAQYRGAHFVECFVIRGGVCVARSGEFVVRIR